MLAAVNAPVMIAAVQYTLQLDSRNLIWPTELMTGFAAWAWTTYGPVPVTAYLAIWFIIVGMRMLRGLKL